MPEVDDLELRQVIDLLIYWLASPPPPDLLTILAALWGWEPPSADKPKASSEAELRAVAASMNRR